MSTPTRPRPIEERLTAALQARADQVTPEDLTPIAVPKARRSRRPVLLAAAVAAAVVAAVVAVPLLGDQGREIRPAPAPNQTSDPTPTVAQGSRSLTVDMDGDGTKDRVRLKDGGLEVVLGNGTAGSGASVAPGSVLLPPVTDAGTKNPLVIALPPAGSDQPATTVTYDEGLVFDQAPETLAVGAGRTVWVDDIGALMLGEYDASVPDDLRVSVSGTFYRMQRGGLVEYGAGDLCWDRTSHEAPVDCQLLPHQDADPSLMFPVVEERYPVGTSHASFDDQYDNIVLERTRDGFEVSYTWDAVESRAPVPPGPEPELMGSAIASSIDGPAVVVAQESGDSTAMTVYAPTSEGFRALDVEGDRFLGNSSGDDPDFLAQRTWMSQYPGLWTASQISEDEPTRYTVTHWTIDDTRLVADRQGEACLDLDRGRKLPDDSCGIS